MNQKERIYKYIERYGSITPLDAFRDLGITKLSTRISEMIEEGVKIEKEYDKCLNRFGEPVQYMRYSFPKESGNG